MRRIQAWEVKGEILEGGNGNARLLRQSRSDSTTAFLVDYNIMAEWVERVALDRNEKSRKVPSIMGPR